MSDHSFDFKIPQFANKLKREIEINDVKPLDEYDDGILEWEYFCDACYFNQWAVRPKGDKNFKSLFLFHVSSKTEAETLCNLLNNLYSK